MTDSVREQIMQAVITALNTNAPAGIPQATRRLLRPLDPSELPAIDVVQASEEVQPIQNRLNPTVKRLLKIRVRAWVMDPQPDQALDPILQWITTALAGNSFNGLAQFTEEKLNEWNAEEVDATYGVVSREYLIEYTTSRTNEVSSR